jgi:phospholipid transport system substrate-binding protein
MRALAICSLAVTFVLIPSLGFSGGVGATAPKAPTPWLKTVVEKGRKLAERKVEAGSEAERKWKAEIKAMANDLLDWDELTKQTLGQAWEGRSQKERTEFAALLKEMIEASYETKIRMATSGDQKRPSSVEIEWTGDTVQGDRAQATAHVKADNSAANLEFKMRWSGERWRVWDVSIDDVSTIRTYRSQFGKIIANQGFPALLERMRKKTAEIRAGLNDI